MKKRCFLLIVLNMKDLGSSYTVTPINPLLESVVNISFEAVNKKVVFPKANVASVLGLNMLYPIPKESFPNPTKPLKKSPLLKSLDTIS